MTTMEQAIDLVRRYTELGKTRNLDELDAIFTPDFVNRSQGGAQHGLDALKEFVSGVWKAFPDLEVTIDTIFADKVADNEPWVGALVTLRGSHAEQDLTINLREVWNFRISEGKIAERWYVVDRAALPG